MGGLLGVKSITVTASHFFDVSFNLKVSLRRELSSNYGPQLAAISEYPGRSDHLQCVRSWTLIYQRRTE